MDNEVVTSIKDALRSRNGVDCDNLTAEDLYDAGCVYFVAPLPKDFQKRVQYLGDLLAQMALNHPVKDDQLRMVLRSIATAFSYLLNSTSYQEGTLRNFDAVEISQKLSPCHLEKHL